MYTLLFPLNIPSTMKISFDELSKEEGSLKFSWIQKGDDYKLKIEGFNELSDAKDSVFRINAGLRWVTINKGLPLESFLETQEITYAENAIEAAKNLNKNFGTNYSIVDGLMDGNRPAIYKNDKQIKEIATHAPTVISNFSGEELFSCFMEGMGFQNSDKIIHNDKLRVAIDLYAAYFTELSYNARFLTLVMVLEALTQPKKRPRFVQNLINQWEKQLNVSEAEFDGDDYKINEIQSIRGTLKHMKEDSLSKQLQELVLSTLQANGDSDAENMAKLMKVIYKDRSELVHDGSIDYKRLKQSTTNARGLAERILRIKFLQIVKG